MAGWKAGDRVLVNPLNKKGLMGEMLDGGMAEYCLVAADQLVAMPAGVSFEDAAALPVAYGTAHRMLITHDTVKGDRVLVRGQRRRRHRLRHSRQASRRRGDRLHLERGEDAEAGQLGADEVINVKEADFSKWAVEKYGKPQRRSYDGGVDVVINFTGGDTWHPAALPQARRQAAGLRRHRRL